MIVRFARSAVKDSINIPFSSVKLGENDLENLGAPGTQIKSNLGKVVVVVGEDEDDSNSELVETEPPPANI